MKVYLLFHDKNKNSKIYTFYEHDKVFFKQKNAEGYGVFASVNDFEATSEQMKEAGVSTMRNIKFLSKINAMFADLDIAKSSDGLSIDERLTRKLKLYDAIMEVCPPSRILQTANGLQPFWDLKDSNISPEYQRRYVDVCNAIIEWSTGYGSLGDKVKDVTRVLRVPGYYHQKNEPFMVEELYSENLEYTLEDLEKAFAKYIKPEKVYVPPKSTNFKLNSVSRQIESLDIQEVAIRAFASIGRLASFDSKKRLILDGRLTGTHQGKTGDGQFLASSSHEPFTGNKITVVADILGTTNKEARKWIIEEFNITPANAKIKESLAATNEEKKYSIDQKVKTYTWGTKGLDRAISPMEGGQLNLITGSTGMGKTTFSLDVAQKNANLGNKVLYISLEQSRSGMIDRLARAASGITKFEWLHRDQITAFKKLKFKEKVDEINSMENLKIYGFNGVDRPTVENITIAIDSYKPDLVFIDNFDDIEKESTSEYTEQNRIIQQLKDFAQKVMIPINVLHHRNQKKAGTGIGTVRGSGKITDTVWTSLKCWREYDQDASPESNAMFTVMHEKDREFGTSSFANVYWQNGTFNDSYIN